MPKFSRRSLDNLLTCDPRLQWIANDAIRMVDFTVLEGHRTEERQNMYYRAGTSKLQYPHSKHNSLPSRAFDFAPWPIDWRDSKEAIARFAFVAGVMFACANDRGIRIRFGWDWNRNLDPRDESFLDWPHVELDEP